MPREGWIRTGDAALVEKLTMCYRMGDKMYYVVNGVKVKIVSMQFRDGKMHFKYHAHSRVRS